MDVSVFWIFFLEEGVILEFSHLAFVAVREVNSCWASEEVSKLI